ncbi:MAG: aminopeptidase P N-terminal domain-containing protein, partial [Bacteroidia bacterium]
MKYQLPPAELFVANRAKLAQSLKPGSIALFHSNDEMPRNGDAYFSFRQNSDLFYLCGIDQEDTILAIFTDCPNPMFREVLFIKETSEQIAIWDGARLTPNEASAASGVSHVFWYHEFWQTIHAVMLMAENIYLNLNENDRFSNKVSYAGLRFSQQIIEKYPLHKKERSAPI